jgi:chaperonin GroES
MVENFIERGKLLNVRWLSFAPDFRSFRVNTSWETAMQWRKEMIVIGDRILLQLDEADDKTKSGLYLPPSVREREKVAMGKVVKVGPGYPIPNPNYSEDEPWSAPKDPMRYIPLQAKEGDYAIFLREQAIEIEFENRKYLIVPQSAVLVIVRDELREE